MLKAACAVKHASCSSSFVPDNFLGLQFKNDRKFKVPLEQAFRADNLCCSLLICFLQLFRGSVVALKTQSFELLLGCRAMLELILKKNKL